MTDAPDTSDPSLQDDCGQAVRDRQLQLLGELAEIGLEVARAVEREAKADEPPPAAELALAYARVSRAVRLTIQLQTQVLEGRAAPARRSEPAQADAESVRKDRVVNIVERIAKAEHDDEEEVEELVYEAEERLDDEDLYGDVMDHPVSEIVARICKDLGLDPDWTALAEELWARREIERGDAGAPLRPFEAARPSPLAGEGDHEMVEGVRRIAALRPLSPFGTAPPQSGEHVPRSPPPPG